MAESAKPAAAPAAPAAKEPNAKSEAKPLTLEERVALLEARAFGPGPSIGYVEPKAPGLPETSR